MQRHDMGVFATKPHPFHAAAHTGPLVKNLEITTVLTEEDGKVCLIPELTTFSIMPLYLDKILFFYS